MQKPRSKLNSSTTFTFWRRSPSMELPKTAIEFPTSPQLILGEEIVHFGHQQHRLSKINLPDLFTCSGCKEYGAGKRFTCPQCDFQLHEFCGSAPQVLKGHPFHCQHHLNFFPKPVKGGISKSKCDACAKPIKGYCFQCSACAFQMHPSCAMLPDEIVFSAHCHTLKLLPASGGGSMSDFLCGECKRRRSGRVYRCTVCDYHLHAVCAKSIINGLHDNGIKGREKPSMLGAAAKLASQVISGFFGGLIEGIGEGVGEVLVQNVARGKRNGRKNKR